MPGMMVAMKLERMSAMIAMYDVWKVAWTTSGHATRAAEQI
jgi:hypothetical protein